MLHTEVGKCASKRVQKFSFLSNTESCHLSKLGGVIKGLEEREAEN
jgi:hypothetical protein